MDRQATVGYATSLWRYPVKSMMGEELDATVITERGLAGDRIYGLIDSSDGKVATAKNPRKWPRLFEFGAKLSGDSSAGTGRVRITLPDGATLDSDQPGIHQILSKTLDREVTLSPPHAGCQTLADNYWPDVEGLDHRDIVRAFGLPLGTFFDDGIVHLLTTSTLGRLRALYPQGRFEVRRFRPNVVIETGDDDGGFIEDAWIGRVLAIGNEVRLSITAPCFRCVMTTLPQGDLPQDLGILRTAAQHNRAKVGVYASVLQGGRVRRGDAVRLE